MLYDSPENFINAMRTALEQGDRNSAQQISFQAVEQYPNHEEIKKFADVLAPPNITVSSSTTEQRKMLEVNREWLRQHRIDYRNRWIALRYGRLLADASSFDELIDRIGREKMNGVFLTVVY